MSDTYTILYIIEGDKDVFPVKISSNGMVSSLKEAIRRQRFQTLASVEAARLRLYHVAIPTKDPQNMDNYIDYAAKVQEEMSKSPPELTNSVRKLTHVFNDIPPPGGTLHIIVQRPSDRTPENRPKGLPELNVTLPYGKSPGHNTVQSKIDEFLHELRPVIHSFLDAPRFSHWSPPNPAGANVQAFYERLEIPILKKKPSLLLHQLRECQNLKAANLFQKKDHKHYILCNTSGSGKTRLLFELLCRSFGFYFVTGRAADNIGSFDFEAMIRSLPYTDGWIQNIFQDSDPVKVLKGSQANEANAIMRVSRILLSRWAIFRAFIGVAKEHYGGIPETVKYDWLLFQILPSISIRNADPFTALINTCLVGVNQEVLDSFNTINAEVVLGPTFNDSIHRFYYVLDEVQVAAQSLRGCFSDAKGLIKRPVLRPILQRLSQDSKNNIVVSGTGFHVDDFRTVVSSGVVKGSEPWHVEYSTGDFSDQETQRSYTARYLPMQFLNSHSGEILQNRMHEWLRGRHRFTARFLEELFKISWDEDGPASPHSMLNKYIQKISGFHPVDGDQTLLAQEPAVESPKFDTFMWDSIQLNPELLDDLARVTYRYILEGKYYGCLSKVKDAIVQDGLGRFIDKRESMNAEQDMDITEEGPGSTKKKPYEPDAKPMVRIEEPIVIISIIYWLERQGKTLYEYIRSNVHHDKGSAFESVVLIALTKLLRNPTKLGRVFRFHRSTPAWAHLPAQIVARSPTGGFVPFDILDGTPLFPSNGVTFFADNPKDVEHWLQHGEAGWCVPLRGTGPDLITRVRLSDGSILLLTIQVKYWFFGNKETLDASTNTKAIHSLIPSNYLSSKGYSEQELDTMLKATDSRADAFTYDILRAIAAYPLGFDLASISQAAQSELNKGDHALATLSSIALATGFSIVPRGQSLISELKEAIGRMRPESDDSPRPMKRRRLNSGDQC